MSATEESLALKDKNGSVKEGEISFSTFDSVVNLLKETCVIVYNCVFYCMHK